MTDQLNLPNLDDLWNWDDPSKSEQNFLAELERMDASQHPAETCVLLTQVARSQGLLPNFKAALQTLDQAQSMSHSHPLAEIYCLIERGRVLNSSGNPKDALPVFRRCFALACDAGEDALAVDAAHMMAIVETNEQQIEWNLKALALAEASAEPNARRWKGSLYNNLGWTYHDSGEFETALAYFEKALAFRETQGKACPLRVARWCVGRALRSLEKHQAALTVQQALLNEIQTENAPPDGFVHEELAELLLTLNKPDQARQHFAHAHALLSQIQWLVRDEPDRIQRLGELANSA